MRTLRKMMYAYDIDNEQESTNTIEEFKAQSIEKGYTVIKSKVDYKTKKDRKTGEIIEENWATEITLAYDV